MKILGVVPYGVRAYEIQVEDEKGFGRPFAMIRPIEGRDTLADARQVARAIADRFGWPISEGGVGGATAEGDPR